MKLKIRAIRDAGVTTQERLVIDVRAPLNIGDYAIFDTASSSKGGVSNVLRGAYWFPDKEIGEGDVVVLYTKAGTAGEKQNKNGTVSHFFYWGRDEALWDSEKAHVVLIRVAEWDSAPVTDTSAT